MVDDDGRSQPPSDGEGKASYPILRLKGSRDQLYPVIKCFEPPNDLLSNPDHPLLTPTVESSSYEKNEKAFIGKLYGMCGVDEMINKQQCSSVSDLERLPMFLIGDQEARLINKYLAIKSFQRSDASKIFKPDEVRPPIWCRKTIHNLLTLHFSADLLSLPWLCPRRLTTKGIAPSPFELSKQTSLVEEESGVPPGPLGYTFIDVYNFLRDRLRSIWQDLTVQHCSKHRASIESLEISYRILIIAEWIVRDVVKGFDRFQHSELMSTCLDKLIGGYLDVRTAQQQQQVSSSEQSKRDSTVLYKSPYEAEAWAYRIVTTLGNASDNPNAFLDVVRKIPQELQKDKRIQCALEAHKAFRSNNSVRYFNIMKKSDFLLAALLHKYSPLVRAKFLMSLKGRVSKQHHLIPLERFKALLGFSEEPLSAVELFCERFSVQLLTQSTGMVSVSDSEVQSYDLTLKRIRLRPGSSTLLERRYTMLKRQSLVDPSYPVKNLQSLDTIASQSCLSSLIERIKREALLNPNVVLQSTTTTHFEEEDDNSRPDDDEVKSHLLSPFGAALLGIDVPKPSVLTTPLSFPQEPPSTLPATDEASILTMAPAVAPPSLPTPISLEKTSDAGRRRLSFAFEGLLTPLPEKEEVAQSERKPESEKEPRFGLSDAEVSEPEQSVPAAEEGGNLLETSRSIESTLEEPSKNRAFLKRKHPDASSSDSSVQVTVPKTIESGVVHSGAKRRLKDTSSNTVKKIEVEKESTVSRILVISSLPEKTSDSFNLDLADNLTFDLNSKTLPKSLENATNLIKNGQVVSISYGFLLASRGSLQNSCSESEDTVVPLERQLVELLYKILTSEKMFEVEGNECFVVGSGELLAIGKALNVLLEHEYSGIVSNFSDCIPKVIVKVMCLVPVMTDRLELREAVEELPNPPNKSLKTSSPLKPQNLIKSTNSKTTSPNLRTRLPGRSLNQLYHKRPFLLLWVSSKSVVSVVQSDSELREFWESEVSSILQFIKSISQSRITLFIFFSLQKNWDTASLHDYENSIHRFVREMLFKKKKKQNIEVIGCRCIAFLEKTKLTLLPDFLNDTLKQISDHFHYQLVIRLSALLGGSLLHCSDKAKTDTKSADLDSSPMEQSSLQSTRRTLNSVLNSVTLQWQIVDCPSLFHILLAAWKRRVESLSSDAQLPTPKCLIDLLPSATWSLADSVFFDPFFIGKDTPETESLLRSQRLIRRVASVLDSICNDTLADETEMSDCIKAASKSPADFIIVVRKKIRQIIERALSPFVRALAQRPLQMPYVLFRDVDPDSRPPWKGLPFPPQCYETWSAKPSELLPLKEHTTCLAEKMKKEIVEPKTEEKETLQLEQLKARLMATLKDLNDEAIETTKNRLFSF